MIKMIDDLNNRSLSTINDLIVTEYKVFKKTILRFLFFFFIYQLYINNKVCPEKCNKNVCCNTSMYIAGENNAQLKSKMNMAFNLVGCMNTNKLKMNAEKTKYMIVRSI